MQSDLIQKYNVPGPRYTSYPTVPYWDVDAFQTPRWKAAVWQAFEESNEQEGISLYLHLPFCESLCTFCGCNRRITKNHDVEAPYLQLLQREWDMYLELFPQRPRIREIHLGGGTPTFFSPAHLRELLEGILSKADCCEDVHFSLEGHPNNTTREHLEMLYALGFRRVSFGVQDYDEKVQRTINRIQPKEHVERVTSWSREIGFTSVSHDLVYGLPFQSLESMTATIEQTGKLLPDRIAFYSYAHVPWVKGVGQRGFSEGDLPKDAEKRALYERGKRMLEDLGYLEIGMDHFALPSDDMAIAAKEGRLHRNFMGYTSSKTTLLVGLGVSAIGDAWGAFAQNEKTLEAYQESIEAGRLPVFRGHLLEHEDLVIRRHILELMCHWETRWSEPSMQFDGLSEVLERLAEMAADGLVEIEQDGMRVTPAGQAFVRNICMAFDLRLWRKQPQTQIFSMTI
ncbi:MAG: oxygen-independent coproporphyrinogen III oxidase [Myxococcales bacterium]|nr:oxygen-independent coproporphyrinogen III oxidase [Myxococcales bacterium]